MTHKIVPIKKRKTSFQTVQQHVGGSVSRNQIELKNCETGTQLTIAASTATFSTGLLLTQIANGANFNQRIGRKVAVTKLSIRWFRSGALVTGDPFRILIVYDHQPNGAAPAITDILVANALNAPVNLNNSDRFMVIMDSYPQAEQGQSGPLLAGKANRKFSPALSTQYSGTSAAIADITTGSIYLFWVNTGQTINAQVLDVYCRVRYTDA